MRTEKELSEEKTKRISRSIIFQHFAMKWLDLMSIKMLSSVCVRWKGGTSGNVVHGRMCVYVIFAHRSSINVVVIMIIAFCLVKTFNSPLHSMCVAVGIACARARVRLLPFIQANMFMIDMKSTACSLIFLCFEPFLFHEHTHYTQSRLLLILLLLFCVAYFCLFSSSSSSSSSSSIVATTTTTTLRRWFHECTVHGVLVNYITFLFIL